MLCSVMYDIIDAKIVIQSISLFKKYLRELKQLILVQVLLWKHID